MNRVGRSEPGIGDASSRRNGRDRVGRRRPSDAWWSAPYPLFVGGIATRQHAFPVRITRRRADTEEPLPVNGAFFSGDTSFFSLNGALHTIGKEKLTGTLRSFWNKTAVELVAKDGAIVLVTTRDPVLYCPEAPITLVNVDASKPRKPARNNARPVARFPYPGA